MLTEAPPAKLDHTPREKPAQSTGPSLSCPSSIEKDHVAATGKGNLPNWLGPKVTVQSCTPNTPQGTCRENEDIFIMLSPRFWDRLLLQLNLAKSDTTNYCVGGKKHNFLKKLK